MKERVHLSVLALVFLPVEATYDGTGKHYEARKVLCRVILAQEVESGNDAMDRYKMQENAMVLKLVMMQTPSFFHRRLEVASGTRFSFNCQLLQKADGYGYMQGSTPVGTLLSSLSLKA